MPAAIEYCAYCDAPLTVESMAGSAHPDGQHPKYCCYGCRLLGQSGQKPAPEFTGTHSAWTKSAAGALISGQAMLLGLAVNLSHPSGLTRTLLHAALILASAAVLGILGWPLAQSAGESLRQRRISIELLFLSGIAGALGASLYSTLSGTGSIYYEVVALLLTVYTVGKTLGAQSRARAMAELRLLRDTFDSCEKLQPDGSFATTRVAEIQVGDRVRVRPGDPIPIDGRVLSGAAFVKQTPLTGEPFPVVCRAGDAVFAGSYSEDGELVIMASARGTHRRLDGLLAMVDNARLSPPTLQAQADRTVGWFLPAVLIVAGGTFVFWTARLDWSIGLYNSMAVLLVACPCAMGLATPLAIWNALAVLAARGLVACRGDVIEQLARLSHVVFDKTGTLSEESLSLIDLATTGAVEERPAILALLAAVQARSSHPVARAFQPLAGGSYSRQDSSRGDAHVLTTGSEDACALKIGRQDAGVLKVGRQDAGALKVGRQDAGATKVRIKPVPARGIEAWVETPDGQEMHLRLGQREWMSRLENEAGLLARLRHAVTDQLVYVEIDGQLRAIGAVRERLRTTTLDAMRALASLGLGCSVMTGDRPERAAGLGLSNVCGSLTPSQKAAALTTLRQAGGQVAFVGDGINDAPALTAASLGIALGHGAGLATANAGAVLYGGDLGTVPWAIALCRQVCASIQSNLIFAAGYNIVGMTLAASGYLHPVAATLLMVLSSFTVSWRALRSTAEAGLCCSPIPGLSSSSSSSLLAGRWDGRQKGGGRAAPILYRSVSARNVAGRDDLHNRPERGPVCRGDTGGQSYPLSDPNEARGAGWAPLLGARSQVIFGALVALQAPFLVYLGKLATGNAILLTVVLLALGLWIACFRTLSAEWQRWAGMVFAMLGAGNWGMILGWWADAGFAPVNFAAGSHCSAGAESFVLSGLMQMPWMNLGMVLAGLPPMVISPAGPGRGLSRISLSVLAALGMLLGMNLGGRVLVSWFGMNHPQRFLIAFAGMTVGMLMGMVFCCELGRAVWLWKRARPRR